MFAPSEKTNWMGFASQIKGQMLKAHLNLAEQGAMLLLTAIGKPAWSQAPADCGIGLKRELKI